MARICKNQQTGDWLLIRPSWNPLQVLPGTTYERHSSFEQAIESLSKAIAYYHAHRWS